MPYDVVIGGCGLSGAVIANILAQTYNRSVLILEKRNHIAGNAYDYFNEDGILVQKYGPHIFHTKHREVYDYLSKFTDWYPYTHKVVAKIDGKLVPVPFNFKSIDELFSAGGAAKIKRLLTEEFSGKPKATVFELVKHANPAVAEFGRYVFDKVFANYTAKQWGIPAASVDVSVLSRVPVVLGYEDGYFDDPYQWMPKGGFTQMVGRMIQHDKISLKLNADLKDNIRFDKSKRVVEYIEAGFCGAVVHTGPIDQLLDYAYGVLPYRSLELAFERHTVEYYQECAVVNYPNEEKFTRITEFKRLSGQKIPWATEIVKEYPCQYDYSNPASEPYYPIENEANRALHRKYLNALSEYGNIFFSGRLADYMYYNMDIAVKQAHEKAIAIENYLRQRQI
jgi:UDP-galactopyranose mutase